MFTNKQDVVDRLVIPSAPLNDAVLSVPGLGALLVYSLMKALAASHGRSLADSAYCMERKIADGQEGEANKLRVCMDPDAERVLVYVEDEKSEN